MNQALSILLAGLAALGTAITLRFFALHSAASGVLSLLDSRLVRVLTGIVFFAVVMILYRFLPTTEENPEPIAKGDKDSFSPNRTPLQTSDDMARIFSGVTDEASRRRAIRDWLLAVPQLTVLIPFIFYLRFGFIGPLGWGLTVFFDVYCLLWAVGLYFRPRREYHSPVKLKGDWKDRVGAFWLVACAFGPLFGWMVTNFFPITQASWHWLYGLRVFLAAGLPILLALPLLRYIRGKSTAVALPLLLLVTLLPVSTAMQVGRDLWEGPVLKGGSELYLQHSEHSLGRIYK